MSVNYNTATLNARLQAVVGQIDANGAGRLRIGTAGFGTILSTIQLVVPSGTVAGGVMTFSGLPLADPLTTVSGTAAEARIEDALGTIVVSGLTVGISTAFDIVMTTTTISSNQTIALTAATITGN